MMTSRLRPLERDSIIHREVFAQVPPKVIYTLSPKGEKLKPVFNELKKWGNENFSQQIIDGNKNDLQQGVYFMAG